MNTTKHATIIDVRSPGEFAGRHIPGAINIPLDEVARNVNEIKKMPKPIVVYCRSGYRSGMAVAMLKQLGITEVANGGGMANMLQAQIA